jgi:Na+-driven multidrug efflux pump
METTSPQDLTLKRIFVFWVPLAATWLMMSVEGPFLAAIIARLTDPKYNLAAYGVAFSFALIIEAPIIMIMSASTALVKDWDSYLKLRNFTNILNALITLVMLLVIFPPVFYWIAMDLINLPENVARLTHLALIILLPWPAAIGFRRFYQGILIRHNLTRRVAYGTIIRLASMATTALILYFFFHLEGAVIGAAGLSVGVTMEAAASRLMVHSTLKELQSTKTVETRLPRTPLTYRYITNFYYPLALTSTIALGVHPIVTFFMGQSRFAIESLAVFPVISSLVFIFRSLGLSFMEVTITLIGDRNEGYRPLRNFTAILCGAVVGMMLLIAFSPAADFWFHTVSGLSGELTDFSRLPTQIFAIVPGTTVLLSLQRGVLVNARKTAPITWATVLEFVSIIVLMFITIKFFDLVGVVAATLSLLLGRIFANGYLYFPYLLVLKKTSSIDTKLNKKITVSS